MAKIRSTPLAEHKPLRQSEFQYELLSLLARYEHHLRSERIKMGLRARQVRLAQEQR